MYINPSIGLGHQNYRFYRNEKHVTAPILKKHNYLFHDPKSWTQFIQIYKLVPNFRAFFKENFDFRLETKSYQKVFRGGRMNQIVQNRKRKLNYAKDVYCNSYMDLFFQLIIVQNGNWKKLFKALDWDVDDKFIVKFKNKMLGQGNHKLFNNDLENKIIKSIQ